MSDQETAQAIGDRIAAEWPSLNRVQQRALAGAIRNAVAPALAEARAEGLAEGLPYIRTLCDELEAEVQHRYAGLLDFPHNVRKLARDLESVTDARAFLARKEAP